MLILLIPVFFFPICKSEVHGSSYLHFLQDDAGGICSGGHWFQTHKLRQTHTSVVFIVVAQNQ